MIQEAENLLLFNMPVWNGRVLFFKQQAKSMTTRGPHNAGVKRNI